MLKRETSLYLDLLRCAAVLLVFISHARRLDFTGGFIWSAGNFSQEAVAVFFVLSGLVISHVTFNRECVASQYAVARLSRLWSVVIPAIILTILLDSVGRYIDPGIYLKESKPAWVFDATSLWRAVSPALFLNSVPPFGVEVGSNGPFWSLSFEAWYYIVFGLAVFLRGWTRIIAVVSAALFAGSAICLLAPLWLLGVALSRQLGRGEASLLAWIGWVGTTVAMVLCFRLKFALITEIDASITHVGWLSCLNGTLLVEKFLPVCIIAINIFCFDRISENFSHLASIVGKPIREMAARSFSIYLYQTPVMFVLAAGSQQISNWPLRIIIIYLGGIGACMVLAAWTEQKKSYLAGWLRPVVQSLRFHRQGVPHATHPAAGGPGVL